MDNGAWESKGIQCKAHIFSTCYIVTGKGNRIWITLQDLTFVKSCTQEVQRWKKKKKEHNTTRDGVLHCLQWGKTALWMDVTSYRTQRMLSCRAHAAGPEAWVLAIQVITMMESLCRHWPIKLPLICPRSAVQWSGGKKQGFQILGPLNKLHGHRHLSILKGK